MSGALERPYGMWFADKDLSQADYAKDVEAIRAMTEIPELPWTGPSGHRWTFTPVDPTEVPPTEETP